jgi:Protein of unknown function (DUF3800)
MKPTSTQIYYAFVDESGSTALSETSHILVVAVLGTGEPVEIRKVIRQFQKKDKPNLLSGELKARKLKPATIKKVLGQLAQSPIQIVAVIVDPTILSHPSQDSEEIYRWAVSCAVFYMVERYPSLDIVLDRRYTKEPLRFELEKAIRKAIIGIPDQYVLIRQEDSSQQKELQAVDFLAWAFFQKYEKNDPQFYDLIAPLVIKEEWLSKQQWDSRQTKKIPSSRG